DRGLYRASLRDRGLARLRHRLRPDPAGLAPQHRGRLGPAAAALRRALPAHVAVLPGRLDGRLPRPPDPAVADRDVAPGRPGRLRRAALGDVSRRGNGRVAEMAVRIHGAAPDDRSPAAFAFAGPGR